MIILWIGVEGILDWYYLFWLINKLFFLVLYKIESNIRIYMCVCSVGKFIFVFLKLMVWLYINVGMFVGLFVENFLFDNIMWYLLLKGK